MLSPLATRNQYRAQQRIQKAALADMRRIWRGMGGDWDRSWQRISPDLVGAVSDAQLKMAVASTEYMTDFLAEVNLADQAVSEVRPQSLVGYSSDGVRLDGLLYGGVVAARESALLNGSNAPQSLRDGLAWLGPVVSSQISDAGRTATMLGTAARPNLTGYTRFLNPPSCQRCAVLAGRVYRYSQGFKRHPQCDCVMQPAAGVGWAKAEGFVSDPTANLSLIKDLSRAQRAAIEAGADISQVVNAGRGMLTVGEGLKTRQITLSGTSARGVFGRAEISSTGQITRSVTRTQGAVSNFRLSSTSTARLTPMQISKQARTRDELVAYLRRYGYLT